eukprot:365313-Chlamydomonas_euryale.AAC.40
MRGDGRRPAAAAADRHVTWSVPGSQAAPSAAYAISHTVQNPAPTRTKSLSRQSKTIGKLA